MSPPSTVLTFSLLVVLGCARLDEDGDGYTILSGDCNEGDPNISPDAQERCDGVDNNCDGQVDEQGAHGDTLFYVDEDGDGYGLEAYTVLACTAPDGYAALPGDCWEGNPEVHPGADEWCDTIDNDCDEEVDESDAVDASLWYPDRDGDGYGDASSPRSSCTPLPDHLSDGSDCNDVDPNIHPDVQESCLTPEDDNCDGDTNDSDASGCAVWYADLDGDSYPGTSQCICETEPPFQHENGGDCNDADDQIHPAAVEIDDWKDNNCDNEAVFPLTSAAAVYVGEADGDQTGFWIDVVDVEEDGVRELLIAAPENDSNATNAGGVYAVSFGATGEVTLSSADGFSFGERSSDRAGYSFAPVGDVDGDGTVDLVVGAYGQDGAYSNGGAAYLTAVPGAVRQGLEDEAVILWGESSSDSAGYRVASAGDVTGDSVEDLLIGAPYSDLGVKRGGIIYRVDGSVTTDVNLGDVDTVFLGMGSYLYAGTSMDGIGDVNGDGIDDVVVGLPRAQGRNGQAHVLLDFNSGVFEEGDRIFDGHYLDGEMGGCVSGLGDLNGDGYSDWSAGAPRASALRPNAGAVQIFYGEAVSHGAPTPASTIVGEHSDTGLCTVASAGDVDGDGVQDVVLGAPGVEYAGLQTGAAYVLFGPVAGNFDLKRSGVRLPGHYAGDQAGYSVAGAGDVNADGFDDIVVGAYGYPEGQNRGAVYVMYGGAR